MKRFKKGKYYSEREIETRIYNIPDYFHLQKTEHGALIIYQAFISKKPRPKIKYFLFAKVYGTYRFIGTAGERLK